MEMTELAGCRVIASAQTITVKNEEGKTCGMVRGVSSLLTIQRTSPRRTYDISQKYKVKLSTPLYNNYFFDGERLYFLHDDGKEQAERQFLERFHGERNCLDKQMEAVKIAAELGAIVVRVASLYMPEPRR
jgi:hypothetical protein